MAAALIGSSVACHHPAPTGEARERAPEIESITMTNAMRRDSIAGLRNGANVVCADEFGNNRLHTDPIARCMPCTPALSATGAEALQHARDLALLVTRAPYAPFDHGPSCVIDSYNTAFDRSHQDPEIQLEKAVYRTSSSLAFQRVEALRTIDTIIGGHLASGDSIGAAHVISVLALAIYDRAQRMDARAQSEPAQIGTVSALPLDVRERLVHVLDRDPENRPVRLRHMPSIPGASPTMGTSEAWWASQLFARAAQLSRSNPASNARYTRLSLAPIILLEEWNALDSAARALIAVNARDSVAPVALALAAYRMADGDPWKFPAANKLFEDALRRMPRADSIAYDAFDGILGEDDDTWRRDFPANVRGQLDRRGWAVIDPVWLTPVNEVLIEHRARVAESNFRYADIAEAGHSGSETVPGVMFVRRGAPQRRWSAFHNTSPFKAANGDSGAVLEFRRAWPGLYLNVMAAYNTAWRAFYSDGLSLEGQAMRLLPPAGRCVSEGFGSTLYECARKGSADLSLVPFLNRLDTVDVTVARFRHSADSVDMYIGARVPLRRFRTVNHKSATSADSVQIGVTIADEFGTPAFHRSFMTRLLGTSDIERTAQWTTRVESGRLMHRVEAVDVGGWAAARGSRRPASAKETFFDLTGFGISDILVADSVSAPSSARRWSDLRVTPNGSVSAPRKSLALAWEIYGLVPGPDGRVHWAVTIRREDGKSLANTNVRGLIIGAPDAIDRVVSTQPDASTIKYTREGPPAAVSIEYLRIPSDSVAGRYVIDVTVQDLVANVTTTRAVSVRVLSKDAQKRTSRDALPPRRDPDFGRIGVSGTTGRSMSSDGYQPPTPPPLPIKPPPM